MSPLVAAHLSELGHDAVHLRHYGLQAADDEVVLRCAASEDRVLISADTDFAALLARSNAARPSVILFRRQGDRRPRRQAEILVSNLEGIRGALDRGSVIIFEGDRIRIRELPIQR